MRPSSEISDYILQLELLAKILNPAGTSSTKS
jgi:hypothetical protein